MTTELRLPSLEDSRRVLGGMSVADLEAFVKDLVDVLWERHDRGDLPREVVVALRNWLAHAHFEASPVVRARVEEIVSQHVDDIHQEEAVGE